MARLCPPAISTFPSHEPRPNSPSLRVIEKYAAQAHPLYRLSSLEPVSSFSDLCLADFVLAVGTLGAYVAFVLVAANDRDEYSDGGQAAGRLAAFMLGVSLLPVSRNSLYLLLLRVPFDRAIRWHRRDR